MLCSSRVICPLNPGSIHPANAWFIPCLPMVLFSMICAAILLGNVIISLVLARINWFGFIDCGSVLVFVVFLVWAIMVGCRVRSWLAELVFWRL